MSFPTIPNVTPSISLSRADVVNLLLASIAFEELGLAHVINAEAEKIQAVLGTLPGVSLTATSISQLLSVNQSVNGTLQTALKTQMLLQFKLEDVLEIPTESTTSTTTTTASTTTTTTTAPTTTTTTTTTTNSTTTTTATVTAACAPALTNAIFANNSFSGSSESIVNANVQINGNLKLTHSGNTWFGTVNVHGTADIDGNTITVNTGAPIVPQVLYNEACLFALRTIPTVTGPLDITTANESTYAGQIVFVNGDVNIGGDVTLLNTTIIATDDVQISGQNVTISAHSNTCFALYSETGSISITNGNYSVTGVLYTRQGDVIITASHGGNICGSIQSGHDVIFTGGSGSQNVTNGGACAPCGALLSCNTICPA